MRREVPGVFPEGARAAAGFNRQPGFGPKQIDEHEGERGGAAGGFCCRTGAVVAGVDRPKHEAVGVVRREASREQAVGVAGVPASSVFRQDHGLHHDVAVQERNGIGQTGEQTHPLAARQDPVERPAAAAKVGFLFIERSQVAAEVGRFAREIRVALPRVTACRGGI